MNALINYPPNRLSIWSKTEYMVYRLL